MDHMDSCCLEWVVGVSGSQVLSFLLFRASQGETCVVEWGVVRYWRKNLYNSCVQFLPSMRAILMFFQEFELDVQLHQLLLARVV